MGKECLVKDFKVLGESPSVRGSPIIMRGIYSIDPDDREYKETINKCKEKVGSSDGRGNAVQERDLREE